MKITFELSIKDYLIFYKKKLKENSLLFKPYIFFIAIIPAVILAAIYRDNIIIINSHDLSTTPVGTLTNFITKLGCLIGIIYLARYLYLERIQKQLSKIPYLIGSQELELTDNKLIWKTQTTKTEYLKESFISFENTSDYFYLNRAKYNALIIPKSNTEFNNQLDKWLSQA